ncbi:MAG: aminotransferase class I/II-fold pyridoxal phosphate-dependent enzyme [Erysipelotrichaceae bacterium]
MTHQAKTPLFEALKQHLDNKIVPFDVPGHKGGRGNPLLLEFLGETTMRADVNSMKPLDNLCHPTSVIWEAECLAAKAFQAHHAFFMVGGTTSAVQTMIMSVCKAEDKIIMPRNVHRSAINALVVCGAKPVYVNPSIDQKLGIPLGMSIHDVVAAMDEHPDAKAILVNNPTYYGICSPLEKIVAEAHRRNMKVLVDEAHGTHFYFGEHLPVAGIHAGADMAAVSMHKTGGSLTQSSFLLIGEGMDIAHVRSIINLTQTTSASYLLMASLDCARANLALHGKEIFGQNIALANYCRQEIVKMGGYEPFSKALINHDSIYDFDETKLSLHTLDLGLAGIEVYDLLRDDYRIQIEFGDLGNILAIISAGDHPKDIERLLSALAQIKRRYQKDNAGMFDHEYITPKVIKGPQAAFYAEKEKFSLNASIGKVCGEFVMAYPPGIPIVAPGEEITQEIIDYILYAKRKGCSLTGFQDQSLATIQVLKGVHDGTLV